MASATNANPGLPISGIIGYDDSGHQYVVVRLKNVTTDSSVTPNVVSGDLGVDVEVSQNPNGQATMANSAPVVIASDQSNLPGNVKQLNGTTISLNQGAIDGGTQRVAQGGASTGTKTNVASSASSVTLLASNASRKGAMIYNDSTQILYLDLTGGTASNSSYSTQVASQGLFEVPGPSIYTGAITGIWASANGNARLTEFS